MQMHDMPKSKKKLKTRSGHCGYH